MNDEFFIRKNVGCRIFLMDALLAIDADHHNWWVFTHHVEHRKRCSVHYPVCPYGCDQCYRPWHDQAGHELVALIGGDLVEVDFHMLRIAVVDWVSASNGEA
jgi:hypothetical protein